jgi:DNA-binding transcriptional regulator YdaS (Cro superfamily)
MNTSQAALARAITVAGGPTALARSLSKLLQKEVRHYAVCKWGRARIPAEYVLAIEQATGVSRHDLRPDIFGPAPATREAA